VLPAAAAAQSARVILAVTLTLQRSLREKPHRGFLEMT